MIRKEQADHLHGLPYLKMKNEKCDAEKKIIIPKLENMIDIYDKLKSNEEKNALLKTRLIENDYS